MEYKKERKTLRHIISIPLIWGVLPAFIFIDICLEIYHRICFPLYGIPYVKRSSYIVFNRHKLDYPPWYDKINCAYCEYANWLLHYCSVITGRTEKYWCAIKHYPKKGYVEPPYHKDFIPYGDINSYFKMTAPRRGRSH